MGGDFFETDIKVDDMRVIAFALCLSLALVACKPSRDANAVDESVRANQRLTGAWVLTSFQPEAPLEPMLAGLLAAQFGNLVVEFDGQWMRASGVGVTTTRRYEVSEATFNRFKLVSYDDKGVAYESWGEFRGGNELWFDSRTSPWRGQGKLARR